MVENPGSHEKQTGWSPQPAVLLVFGGFLAVAIVLLVVALTTGGDDPSGETVTADPTDEPATEPDEDAADQPAPDSDADSAGDQREESGDEGIATEDAGDEMAASELAHGGGEWLVPWQDGFLRFGFVFQPQPLPELDGRFADLFPPEVRETIEAAGATTIDDAMQALEDAGLIGQVFEILDANHEVADWFYGVEPLPPAFEAAISPDGLDWTPIDGVTVPGGEGIAWVQSDGSHLVVASHRYDEMGFGNSTPSVAVTSDLRDWEVHEITVDVGDDVPDVVRVDTSIGGLAIRPDGWIAATNTYTFIDDYALVPDDIREQAESGAWWDLTAEDAGLRVDLYESEYEIIFDENGEFVEEVHNEDCCDLIESRVLSWESLGLDRATWDEYRAEGGGSTMAVWIAPWGAPPVEHQLPPEHGSIGSLVATNEGFMAVSWPPETEGSPLMGNDLLFSTDGRTWNAVGFGGTGIDYIDQLVPVDGGVIATGSNELGQSVLLGAGDGTGWRSVDIPGIPDNTWIWFNAGSGPAGIVDATDYSIYDDCHFGEELFLEFDLPGHLLFFSVFPDGTNVFIEELGGGGFFDLFSVVRYPDGTPEFMVLDDATGEVAFVDPDSGDEVVRMPADDLIAAYEAEAARSEDVPAVCESLGDDGPGVVADFWLVATVDGLDWLVEDLDESGLQMDYPQQAAINGNVVVARVGELWISRTIT